MITETRSIEDDRTLGAAAEVERGGSDVSGYRRLVLRIIRRRWWHPADHEDLVQDVLLRLCGHPLPADPTEAVRYVTTVAHNVVNDRLRQLGRHPEAVPLDCLPEDCAFTPSPEGAVAAVSDFLCRADGLDAETCDLVLSRAEGATYEELAERFGVALGTVKSRLARARAAIAAAA